MTRSEELEFIKAVGRKAGEIVLRYYHEDYAIEMKGEDDPVTVADHAANTFIVEQIQKTFPDDGILAEETTDDRSRLEKRRCWLIDPLDGTKEFINKNGEFSIMVALVEDHRPVVGMVYWPPMDKLYYAAKGFGAWLEHRGERRRLHVSATDRVEALKFIVSRSHRHPVITEMLEVLGIQEEIPSGSGGIKIGRIAEQEADLYLSFSAPGERTTKVWDICAADILLHEAGGRYTDLAGNLYRYNLEGIDNPGGILASNGVVHDEIVARILPICQREGLFLSAPEKGGKVE